MMKKNENQQQSHSEETSQLTLGQLFRFKSTQWLVAWLIGLVTVIATVGLLALSGWFISAAALAGLVLVSNAISFDFFRPAAVIRAFAITRTAGRYGERLASHHAVLGLLTDLRVAFFGALARQKISFVSQLVQSSDTMQRLTHDIDQLDELPLRFWAPWLWAVLLQFALLGFIAVFSSSLVPIVIIPLFCAGIILPAAGVLLGKKIAYQHTERAEVRRRNLLNPLTISTSLILWQRWHDFQVKLSRSDAHYNTLHLRVRRIAMILHLLQELLLVVVILLLIIFGYPLVQQTQLSVPLLLAYVLAVMGLVEVLSPLTINYTSYGFAVASKERLNELINNTPDDEHLAIDLPEQKYTFPQGKLTLEADGVCARFPNALSGVQHASFQLQSGDVLFIKGRSGAGKSTLLHVLTNELALSSGKLALNGQPLHKINIAEHVGFLAQQLDIFDMSLAENLRVGNAYATDEELWQALAKVNLMTWAQTQPKKLATQLGEYGSQLSGGQARRVALARLLLKQKNILVLDEPFAGLDAENAKHVYEQLKQVQKEGLLIIVSHQYIPEDAQVISI